MNFIYIEDTTNGYLEVYAVTQLEVYKGKFYDELFFAEIRPRDGLFELRWEDDWFNKITLTSMIDVKDHIEKYYYKHTPHINGRAYDADEM
jgi:hypothetical protein